MLNTEQSLRAGHRGRAWIRLAAQLAVVAVLLCLAALNIAGRAAWSEMEDGVLWAASTGDLTAREIAPGSPAERAGLRAGDVLMAIDRKPVDSIEDVVTALHAASDGQALSYTVLRMQSQELISVAVAPSPSGPLGLYYVLAAVGIFGLLVGASVRLRRPENQATLHFFWLSTAFFGVLAFSSAAGSITRPGFLWGDVVAMLLLPPLFVHFALVFPEGREAGRARSGATLLPVRTFPRCCSSERGSRSSSGEAARRGAVSRHNARRTGRTLYLAALSDRRAGGHEPRARHVRSVTARRQLRWIVWGTAFGAVPFVWGTACRSRSGSRRSWLRVQRGAAGARAACLCVGYRALPADGRRGHHQARPLYAAALAGIAANLFDPPQAGERGVLRR